MKSGGSYLQGYNCQVAVDADHQVIVELGVSNQPPDAEHLEPILERMANSAGALPAVMTMDAGYWSEENANTCANQGLMPTSPPAAYRMASHHRRNAALSPEVLMPKPAWLANSEERREQRSTPSAKRSWSR
jgi:hypothetical protein